MLNQIVLVGRLVKTPEVRSLENGAKQAFATLAVPRSYKNSEGVYETDFIDCVLWDTIATNTAEYCKKGDIVGVRGRIQSNTYEDSITKDKKSKTEVICEKITFLSSRNKENENDNDSELEPSVA